MIAGATDDSWGADKEETGHDGNAQGATRGASANAAAVPDTPGGCHRIANVAGKTGPRNRARRAEGQEARTLGGGDGERDHALYRTMARRTTARRSWRAVKTNFQLRAFRRVSNVA